MNNRIAVISFHTCPLAPEEGKETGGMNVYVRELATQLTTLGYTVDVFTRKQDPGQNDVVSVMPGFRVIHIPAGPLGFIHRNTLYNYVDAFTQNVFEFVEKEGNNYAIIDCHYYLSGIIGEKLQTLLKNHPPLFMTFHRIGLMKNLLTDQEDEAISRIRIQAEKLLVRKAAKIISPSATDSTYLQKLYGAEKESIAIVTPGIDTDIFCPLEKQVARAYTKAASSEKIILFVGRPEPDKGLDTLLYAFKILYSKYQTEQLKLWIVGGDVEKPQSEWGSILQKIAMIREELDLHESVIFIERKLSKQLPYYFNSADITVMPSFYESFGMTALESLACGTPVITTTTAGISELVERIHPGLITCPNNALTLASKMDELLHSEDHQQKAHQSCLDNRQEFSWQTIARRISNLYENVLSV